MSLPLSIKTPFKLSQFSIPQESLSTLALQSPRHATLQLRAPNQNQIVILPLDNPSNLFRSPIAPVDVAILHPSKEILCLQAGKWLQLVVPAEKRVVMSTELPHPPVFLSWLDEDYLGVVTPDAAYQWNVSSEASSLEKSFDPPSSLVTIWGFTKSQDGEWLCLHGESKDGDAVMQLHSLSRKAGRQIAGNAARFAIVNGGTWIVYVARERGESAFLSMVCLDGEEKGERRKTEIKGEGRDIRWTVVSVELSTVFVVGKEGTLHIFDWNGKHVSTTRFAKEPVLKCIPDKLGFKAISISGTVFMVDKVKEGGASMPRNNSERDLTEEFEEMKMEEGRKGAGRRLFLDVDPAKDSAWSDAMGIKMLVLSGDIEEDDVRELYKSLDLRYPEGYSVVEAGKVLIYLAECYYAGVTPVVPKIRRKKANTGGTSSSPSTPPPGRINKPEESSSDDLLLDPDAEPISQPPPGQNPPQQILATTDYNNYNQTQRDTPSSLWAVTPDIMQQYHSFYDRAPKDPDGFVGGATARELFSRSGIDTALLAKIWQLSDIDGDGKLNRTEFCFAMHLINMKRNDIEVPDVLPQDLIQSISGAMDDSGAQPAPHHDVQEQQPGQQVGEQPQPAQPPQQLLSTQEEIYKLFREYNEDGFISGKQTKEILIQTGLPNADLARVWKLADQDRDNRLSKAEFATAIYLVQSRLKGNPLPERLQGSKRFRFPVEPHELFWK